MENAHGQFGRRDNNSAAALDKLFESYRHRMRSEFRLQVARNLGVQNLESYTREAEAAKMHHANCAREFRQVRNEAKQTSAKQK